MIPRVRTAEVLAVGTELLTPHRIDSNSLFLAGRLDEIGIELRGKAVVADDINALRDALSGALDRVDVVITTGGLGPTSDDLTRESVSAVTGAPLDEDPVVLAAIEQRFTSRRIVMPAANRRQALVPRGAEVLPNPRGTAPGLWVEWRGRPIVCLPGPPRELQPMFDDQVLPRLARLCGERRVRRRVLKITGRSESMVEEVAHPIYSKLGTAGMPVATTILASPGLIEVHLSAAGTDTTAVDAELARGVRELSEALGAPVFSTDGRSLEQVVGDLLAAKKLTIGAAESCTGGLLLGRLTDVPGSSTYVLGGIVAYSNEIKTGLLNVPAAVLAEHGAVSEPVAAAMADGVRARLRADVGVGITGIAGPTGGTAEKPVGTVVIAACQADRRDVKTFRFIGDRQMIRTHSVAAALDMVRRLLQA
jgi:nicotinamide-nucleotide amidase